MAFWRALSVVEQLKINLGTKNTGLQIQTGILVLNLLTNDQALNCVQRQIDQCSISSALDLKVSEQYIGSEVVQHFINDVLFS